MLFMTLSGKGIHQFIRFKYEIVSYSISTTKWDKNTYIDGLNRLIEKKKEYKDLKMILHSDQGSVYSL